MSASNRDPKLLDLDSDSNLVQSYKYEDDIRLPYPRLWITFSVDYHYEFSVEQAEIGTAASIRFGGYDWFPLSYREITPQTIDDKDLNKSLEERGTLFIYSAFCAPSPVFRVVTENVANSSALADKCKLKSLGQSISLQEAISIRNQPLGVILAQYNAAIAKQYAGTPDQAHYLRVVGSALVTFSLRNWDSAVREFEYSRDAIQVSKIFDSPLSKWRAAQPPLSTDLLSFWERLLGNKLEMNLGFAIPSKDDNYNYKALYQDTKKVQEETSNIPKAVSGFCYNIKGPFVESGAQNLLLVKVVEDSQITSYPTKYTFTIPDFTSVSYTEGTPHGEFR